MAKRIVTKIGNVFCVELGNGTKGYFQYIAKDLTQLNSSVIRVFRTHYPIDADVKINDIVKDEIDFYAHAILRSGIADEKWYKVGKSLDFDPDEVNNVIFGSAEDIICEPGSLIPQFVDPLSNWYIWRINHEFVPVGSLPGELVDKVEPGSVFQYPHIIDRMERGYYSHSLDEYEIIKRKPRPEYVSYIKIKYNRDDIAYTEFYLCFKGNYFEKEIIVKSGTITRITRDEAILNHLGIARKKFSDTNWEYNNFITEDEFNQIWNS